MPAFASEPIRDFNDRLASSSPTPGGGAAAALMAASAASLVSMTASLTVGKEKYRANWNKMSRSVEECLRLRRRCETLADEDAEAYGSLMAALRMPKDTDEQKSARASALSSAARRAAEVPLETMELCSQIAALALEATIRGNQNAISDSASGAIFALASARAAAMNVDANICLVDDDDFAESARLKAATIIASIERCEAEASRALTKAKS